MLRAASVMLALAFAVPATAAEKVVAKISIPREGGRPSVELQVTRTRGADGSVSIKLYAKGGGERPQSITIYEGGGDVDGFGDDDVRAVKLSEIALPGRLKGARVDVAHQIADGKKGDERTDTALVGLGGNNLHKVLELTTRVARARSKLCREAEETTLSFDGSKLVATTQLKRDPALDDDDLPIDKTCRSPSTATKKIYAWSGDRFSGAAGEGEGEGEGDKDED